MQTAALTSESLPLRGVLDEFRTALREEILAAQRSSSSNAVQLKKWTKDRWSRRELSICLRSRFYFERSR